MFMHGLKIHTNNATFRGRQWRKKSLTFGGACLEKIIPVIQNICSKVSLDFWKGQDNPLHYSQYQYNWNYVCSDKCITQGADNLKRNQLILKYQSKDPIKENQLITNNKNCSPNKRIDELPELIPPSSSHFKKIYWAKYWTLYPTFPSLHSRWRRERWEKMKRGIWIAVNFSMIFLFKDFLIFFFLR